MFLVLLLPACGGVATRPDLEWLYREGDGCLDFFSTFMPVSRLLSRLLSHHTAGYRFQSEQGELLAGRNQWGKITVTRAEDQETG